MDIGSIFLILAILIPVGIYVSLPFFAISPAVESHSDQDISAMLAKRDQVVASIQDLDDDYNLGKIPTETYSEQRKALLENGAVILRQIDTYQAEPTGLTAEDRLEEAIVARRLTLEMPSVPVKKNGNAVPPVPDDDIEQRIASRRRTMNEKAGGFCPKCGRPVHVSDRFCPKCGGALA
jgi:hypothetical protein